MTKMHAFFDSSGRFIFVILLFIISFCFAMFQGGFVSWFLFFFVSPFLLYSFILFFVPERIVSVERQFEPSRIVAGENVRVTVKVKRKTFFPFVYITMDEILSEEALYNTQRGSLRTLMLVGFKREFEWSYEMEALSRGEHSFKALGVVFHDFFGWGRKKLIVDEKHTIIVYPRVFDMKDAGVHMQFDMGNMSALFSIAKDTTMATGVRDYQSGDRFSWIHWKSFAKSLTLRTKEFEDRRSRELFVMLDRSSSENFDDAVELVASILHTIIKKNGDISLLSVGEQRAYFPRIQGSRQLEKVMYHLATIEANYTRDLESLLMYEKAIKQGATLLFVTSELTEEKLLALSRVVKQCVCLIVTNDPVSAGPYRDKASNIRLLYVPKEDYYSVFTEVMKP